MLRGTLSPVLEPLYAPRMRPERLIAAGRVVLAVSSLFAVWLDPDEPIRHAAVAYGVLLAYVVYAATVATLLWRVEAVPRLWPLVTHAVDLVCFSLFIFFTDPTSPFTVYFVFALLAATLRWQVRGTMWTATIVITVFFGFGIYFGIILDDPEFDLRGFIIRSVYLFVLAGLFGYVGTQDRRTVREMSRLATWPETVRADTESLARDLLAYAAPLLEAPDPLRRLHVLDLVDLEEGRLTPVLLHLLGEPLEVLLVLGREREEVDGVLERDRADGAKSPPRPHPSPPATDRRMCASKGRSPSCRTSAQRSRGSWR